LVEKIHKKGHEDQRKVGFWYKFIFLFLAKRVLRERFRASKAERPKNEGNGRNIP
jgi:hypothetical protein